MDRHDERKDALDTEDTQQREGDVLGLSGSTVPKMPGDPSASDDPQSVRQRRERALSPEDDPTVSREDPYKQGKGATGIDMGAGGSGTDVEGS